MRNIWAVTRQTFIQCLRTRIVVVFCLLLAVCVLGIGFKMTGDGTLKGRIQTFLSYSTSLTQMLLCLVTIFLTTSIITGDIRHKYVFTVVSKPLARWQYVLGRWCGVVGLMGLLLATAMVSIYFLSQHIRKQPTRIERDAASALTQQTKLDLDRLGVENEIFTARKTYLPEPPNIEKAFQQKIKQLIEERGKDNLIRDHIKKLVPDEDKAKILLKHPDMRQKAFREIEFTLRKQIIEEARRAKAGKSIEFIFTGLKPASSDESLLQIRYKLNALRSSKTILASTWQVVNSDGPDWFLSRSDSAQTTSSFMLDPRAVSKEGRLAIFYINRQQGTAIKIQPGDVAVLQRIGSFESNLVRAGLMIMLRLMFLAAVSVLFGVFLSFPITCLSVMMIFTIGMTSGFLHDATRLPQDDNETSTFEYFSHYLVKGVFVVVPTFSATSVTNSLVDGEYIAPKTLIKEYLMTFHRPGTDSGGFWKAINLEIQTGMGLRTLLALAIGWLIFRRRELAGIT